MNEQSATTLLRALILPLALILSMILNLSAAWWASSRSLKSIETALIHGGSLENRQLCHTPNLYIMEPAGESTSISSAWCQRLNDQTCWCSPATTSTEP